MENAIARIGRDNHMKNLIGKLPLITAIFGLQCFFLLQMKTSIHVGDFATMMGCFLIAFIGSLYVYDRYHHVIIYKDQIVVYFSLFNMHRSIPLNQIKEIIAPEEECDFSSLSLVLNDEETVSFHFVDYPVQVKSIIEDLQKGLDVTHRINQAA